MNRNEDYRKSPDWIRFRKHWLHDNPPMDTGYYLCGICGNWVAAEEVTLDHIEPRTSENMFKASNIQPAHGICNYNKGSKHWKPKVSKEQYELLKMLNHL